MNRKLHISIALTLLLPFLAQSQSYNWQWLKSVSGTLYSGGQSIATDKAGKVFIAGFYRGISPQFDSITLNGSIAFPQIFLSKHDPDGSIIWLKTIGGSGSYQSGDVATDNAGNVYLTGSFLADSIQFDSLIELNSDYKRKAFLVKYNSAGAPQWAITAGGMLSSDDEDAGFGVAIDGDGSVFISGRINSDTMTFGNISLVKTGVWDMYLAKIDPSGYVLWAKRFGNSGLMEFNRIATDESGNIFFGLHASAPSPLMIDTISVAIPVAGRFSLIGKLNTSGSVLWVAPIFGMAAVMSIATDPSGNVVAVGQYMEDSLQIGNVVLYNNSNCTGGFKCFDMFIAKFDSSGNLLWARSEGGDKYDLAYSVAIDDAGKIFVTGGFSSSILQLGNFQLSGFGADPFATSIFVSEYDPNGNILWAGQASSLSLGTNFGSAISCGGAGEVYITGEFSSPSINFGNLSATKAGIQCYFASKLSISSIVDIQQKIPTDASFRIYPNPTTGVFTITPSQRHPGSYEIRVFSMLGEKVASYIGIGNEDVTMDISNLAKGTYVVHMTSNSAIGLSKLLVYQ